jgi:2-polyprenyl-3-methyl-5-hydroxy-6-metoxy-1,4-benzoquinol methylase
VRYRIDDLTIRSENAAKPASQKSAAVTSWLRQQQRVADSLDYGCGKLRYATDLAARSRRVTFVDSDVQIRRQQVVLGRRTTVIDCVASRWHGGRVLTVEEYTTDPRKYDLVLCANVLSAIPSRKRRLAVLRGIRAKLKKTGVCLLVSQYRNSYFNAAAHARGSRSYEDGWILSGRHGPAFYAPLGPERLQAMARRAGMVVREVVLYEGSVLLAVRRLA